MTLFFSEFKHKTQSVYFDPWMNDFNDLVIFCESNAYSILQLSDLNPCSYNVVKVLLLEKKQCNQWSLVLEQMTLMSRFFLVKQKHTTQPV